MTTAIPTRLILLGVLREAFAARYQSGQPLGELEAVACRAGDFEMTEIPLWRCLLVRTWPENVESDYQVVADGAGWSSM